MKAGKKSENRTNALINKNFVIRVVENHLTNTKSKLTSANKLSKYLLDEKLKIKLFEKVLSSPEDNITFLIRKRLKIVFCSK